MRTHMNRAEQKSKEIVTATENTGISKEEKLNVSC